MSEGWRQVRKRPLIVEARPVSEVEYIETLEGTKRANPGDWVVRGIQGEMYPVAAAIFAQTYHPWNEMPSDPSTELWEGTHD